MESYALSSATCYLEIQFCLLTGDGGTTLEAAQ